MPEMIYGFLLALTISSSIVLWVNFIRRNRDFERKTDDFFLQFGMQIDAFHDYRFLVRLGNVEKEIRELKAEYSHERQNERINALETDIAFIRVHISSIFERLEKNDAK